MHLDRSAMNSVPSPLPFRSLVFSSLFIFLEPTDCQILFQIVLLAGSCLIYMQLDLHFHFSVSLCHRLLSAVLRTSEVESRATRASLTELLSPQMGKDIVWFLRRWAKTYLLVDEKLYSQVSCQNEINQSMCGNSRHDV